MLNRANTPFGHRLRELMISKNIDAKKLCEKTGILRATLNQILLGVTVCPNAELAYKLAKALEVPMERFFSNEPPPKDQKEKSSKNSDLRVVPVIETLLIPHWFTNKETFLEKSDNQRIILSPSDPEMTLAVKCNLVNNQIFQKDSILIVHPLNEYHAGDFVFVSIHKQKLSIRLIVEESEEKYLLSVITQLKPDLLDSHVNIFGKIVRVIATKIL